ncbi:hypothetical protein Kpol_416p7 [Vanderwaltozyma polyspora DSM 70294]|uniref:NAD-dependent epimerase/dehydratase domain-containing protein n=1 Tax=Vanderwaltozyma polyspora (strain ATCC 22028 / DSM 70294 / BCRC 21397 / CBS 2163 / NBRC 10782 / NRRL Y-8283 / UCD 57-17) TaxID=436907 RepID=A7TRL9_VANPO|nr:uncharacterized protein Kpol_416p7 [Vanderwaltozyma polyspora DSM 70294]EDO15092.1 hypothetical protein Kpol_416p7 [Vanderwaltozyma polyspora DSM 70294]
MSVLISGATGFIAQHIVGDLLDQNYKVIGTARSQGKIDKLIKQFGNNPNFQMEIVEDISKLDAFDAVFQKHGKDIKYVLHTASPFHFNTTEYEKDLLIPAANGTKGILESIKKYAAKTVERVVVTSSFAAIMDFATYNDGKTIFTEESWNPVTWEGAQANAVEAYCGSKKFAEKTAWDFLKENEGQVSFKLSTVNPVFVFGPQKFLEDAKGTLNTSCEFVNQMIHAKPTDEVTTTRDGEYIDVRDVAKAHILAMQEDKLIGKRLLMQNGPFTKQDIVNILNDKFPKLKGSIPKSNSNTDIQKATFFNNVNSDVTKNLLGFKLRTLEETIYDTAEQILKNEAQL